MAFAYPTAVGSTASVSPQNSVGLSKEESSRKVTVQAPGLPKGFLPVPIVRQATRYSCGAAVLLAVLYYWQVFDGPESGLYERLETTPEDGTEPPKIIQVAKSFGLKAEMKENAQIEDLRQALKRGETAILDLQAWPSESSKNIPWREMWEEGHYVVLVGMDERYLYAMDPVVGSGYAYVPIEEFLERWHDYEDRHGAVRRYHHPALFLSGKNPLKSVPGPLIRME